MAKTLLEQLQAAAAAGDLEQVRTITEKMTRARPKPAKKAAPRPRNGRAIPLAPDLAEPEPGTKSKAAKAAPEPPAPSPRGRKKAQAPSPLLLPSSYDAVDEDDDEAVDSLPLEDDGAGEFDPRNASWMAPAKRPESAPQTRVDASGNVRQQARRVSMRGHEFQNTFRDRGQGGYDRPSHARLDKANGRNEAAIDRRPPARKVKVRCGGCRKPFAVYPAELRPVIEEDGSGRELVYHCERCTKKGLV